MLLKMTYTGHPHLPEIEIEDTPQACAQFLAELEAFRAAKNLTDSTKIVVKATIDKPFTPAKKERPARRESGRRTGDDGEGSVRTYRGKPNRRHMVLEAFRALAAAGNTTPGIEEIRAQFATLFPDESIRNLGQVVRDMVNKTDLIERLEWGTFRLRPKDRVGNGLGVLDDAF